MSRVPTIGGFFVGLEVRMLGGRGWLLTVAMKPPFVFSVFWLFLDGAYSARHKNIKVQGLCSRSPDTLNPYSGDMRRLSIFSFDGVGDMTRQ
ncbi:hypothetical protein CCP2SC5_400013 [Azospirillaceae bacterium]